MDPADRLRYHVKRLLAARGENMATLAGSVGRSTQWLSQLLSGRRATTFATLTTLAQVLDVDVVDLLKDVPVTSADTQKRVESGASTQGERPDGRTVETDLLRAQLARERAATEDLKRALTALGRQLIELGEEVPATAAHKTKTRTRHRGTAR